MTEVGATAEDWQGLSIARVYDSAKHRVNALEGRVRCWRVDQLRPFNEQTISSPQAG